MTGEGAEYQVRGLARQTLCVRATTRPLRARGWREMQQLHRRQGTSCGAALFLAHGTREVTVCLRWPPRHEGCHLTCTRQVRRRHARRTAAIGRSLDRCGRFGRPGQVRSGLFKRATSRQRTHAATRLHDSTTLFSHAHRDGEMDGPRPVARLGIGFAESHAAPHERALGRLLSAASSAQHPPARSPNSPFLYDISQRSETRASPSRPYNTFTQRAKEPPYQRVYIVFFSRPNSAQCQSFTKLR